jgi:hypothetical protein
MSFRHFLSRGPASARNRVPRILAVLLLGLQALLWGGGSIVEARAAAESLARYTHVEDEGTSTCPPIHSHLDCLICRTFAAGALTARPRDLLPLASGVSGPVNTARTGHRTEGFHGPLGSRAPPPAPNPIRPVA